MTGRIHVDTVIVGPVTVDVDPSHGGVLSKHQVIDPERRIPDRVVLQQHAMRAQELDGARTQIAALSEHTTLDRNAVVAHLPQPQDVCQADERVVAFAVPAQKLAVRVAVDQPLAGDRNVLHIGGVDQR